MMHAVTAPRAPVTTVSAIQCRRASASDAGASTRGASMSKSKRVDCVMRVTGAMMPSARRVATFATRHVAAAADADDAPKPQRRVRKISENPRAVAAERAARDGAKKATAAAAPTDDSNADAEDEDDAAAEEGTRLDLKDMYGDETDGSWDEEEETETEEEADEEEDVKTIDVLSNFDFNLLSGDPPGHKSGYVAIVGRPNAGKSTLLNQLVGTKLSIVTFKPQTTRHRILGIVSEETYQMVLLDTPGVMKEEFNKLDEMMLKSVRNAMANADVLLAIVDATRDPYGAFEGLLPEQRTNPAPLGVIVNKCDLLEVDEIREVKEYFERIPGVQKVFPVSALAGVGHDAVQKWALTNLPEGPTLYPKDTISEHPERFFIAEIIREKIFLQYQQEVPYSTQVWVQSHKERDGVKKDLIIAKIFCERKSQMGILIGSGGKALKELSTAARLDIETFLGRPVFLDLGVKVREGWRSEEAALEDLGLDDPNKLEQPALGPAPDITA